MIKSFLILISISILLFSSQQIVLVVADDFNSSIAKLEFYDDDKLLYKNSVNLGTNGLGWGIGEHKFRIKENEPLKYEGDKKAPAGIFKLTDIFGYSKSHDYKLPYLYTSNNLICIDDSNNNFYNHIVLQHGDEKSFEFMKRQDHQYRYGVVVAHNEGGVFKRGSCIFLHIQKDIGKSTAGCTSMEEKDLVGIVNQLDRKKNPLLIQIPKAYSKEVLKIYPYLKTSKLLSK